MMTIIYLINHSTSKLFNAVCNKEEESWAKILKT